MKFHLEALVPRLVIQNVDDAITYYRDVFGAELEERYTMDNDVVVHAALRVGQFQFTLTEEVKDWGLLSPKSLGGSPLLLHLTVSDPDELANAMVVKGAEIVISIEDRDYGKREGRVADPFGHLWILSRPL